MPKFKFQHMNKIVFAFVTTALALLILFAIMIVINQKIFVEKFYYTTVLDNARGLEKKPPIYFKGYEIGRIDNFDLNEKNLIDVQFYIYENYTEKILKYSVISRRINPLSNEVEEFEILIPEFKLTADSLIMPINSFIPFVGSEDGQKNIREGNVKGYTDDISGIVGKLNEILATVSDKSDSSGGLLYANLRNLSNLTGNLEKLSGEILVNKSMNKLDNVLRETDNLLKSTQKTMNYVNQSFALLDSTFKLYSDPNGLIPKLGGESVQRMFNNTDTTLMYLKETLQKVHAQRHELSPLLLNINETLIRLQKTLQGVNNHPFIEGGIKDEKMNTGIQVND